MKARRTGRSAAAARRFLRARPMWVRACAGVVSVVIGVMLAVRPFASITLLLVLLGVALVVAGGAEVLRGNGRKRAAVSDSPWIRGVVAVLLVLAGLVVLLLPGLGLRATVLMVGIALLTLGAREVISAFVDLRHRVAGLLSGAASVLFGLLALTWRDVTALALGVILGCWLAVQGARLLLDVWIDARGRERRERRHGARIAVAALSLVLAVLVSAVGGRLVGTPRPDEFYAAPASVPAAPGELLRAEPFTRAIPAGATAWRMLYTTTRDEGVPAIASGLVIVPDGSAPAPVIAWDHGTTGAAVGCAPTLLPDPLAAGAMPDAAAAVDAGWAIVATDYIGLGADPPHDYLVGQQAARATLDAVRAARQLNGAHLGDQVTVWGHSQGGGAALWTGGLWPSYAPEIDIVGVAAMAPAANLPTMVADLADGPAGTLVGPLVLASFAHRYDDVRVADYLRPAATLLYQETLARCWSDPAMVISLLQAVAIDRSIFSQNPQEGPLAARLEENVPRLPIDAPLLIAQGLADTLVPADAQDEYVASLCAAGQRVDYRTYPGQDHLSVVSEGSPLLAELMQWTSDRFAGKPSAAACP